MIFEPAVCRQILTGRKTQVRVPMQDGPPIKKGRVVAIQPGVGRKAFGRMQITDVYSQSLREFSFADAKAEGHKTRAEFFEDWSRKHDDPAGDLVLVWVMVVTVDADEPRLLTPSSRPKGTTRGYTNNPVLAMRDEPEALSDSQLLELSKYRPAVDQERRRQPVLDACERVVRELDLMQAELRIGTYSQQARRMVRSLRRQLGSLERSL